MINSPVIDQTSQKVGEEWIQAVLEKDFPRLAEICQPEVRSRLMTPKRVFVFENASDVSHKVEDWFHECSGFQKEQVRIAWVGGKLGIFYRLSFIENGQSYVAEQQLYCSLRDGRIDQLSLLCSGFQPLQDVVNAPTLQPVSAAEAQQPNEQIRTDAFLKFDTSGGQASTCTVLTPAIKHRLSEMSSGQVLEVQVDDPSAGEDIEAWCRLSGNALLKLDAETGQELHFYLRKK
jgi:tRNA 2-thiouridine synthesizing protein A